MKDSFEGGTNYSTNTGGNLGLYHDRLRRIIILELRGII